MVVKLMDVMDLQRKGQTMTFVRMQRHEAASRLMDLRIQCVQKRVEGNRHVVVVVRLVAPKRTGEGGSCVAQCGNLGAGDEDNEMTR